MSIWVRPPGPVAQGLRIGLLGGSFNPAHEGHRHVSEVALKALGLDYVWWLVTPQNPLKSADGLAALDSRLQQAKTVAHHPRIVVTDIERDLGTRYSIDTLKALHRRFLQVDFFWLMGSDNLATFRRWRDWREIVELVPLVVVQRPGSTLAALNAMPMQCFGTKLRPDGSLAITILDGLRNTQSSTALRARQPMVSAGRPC